MTLEESMIAQELLDGARRLGFALQHDHVTRALNESEACVRDAFREE